MDGRHLTRDQRISKLLGVPVCSEAPVVDVFAQVATQKRVPSDLHLRMPMAYKARRRVPPRVWCGEDGLVHPRTDGRASRDAFDCPGCGARISMQRRKK
jgi:hypothetical protein